MCSFDAGLGKLRELIRADATELDKYHRALDAIGLERAGNGVARQIRQHATGSEPRLSAFARHATTCPENAACGRLVIVMECWKHAPKRLQEQF